MNFLFDLDDTLYPEKQYIYQGFWNVACILYRKHRLDCIETYLKLVEIFRSGSSKVFNDFVRSRNINEEVNYIVDIYRKSDKKLYLYKDVLESLKYLKKVNSNLILVTNGRSETQWYKIKHLGLREIFDDIFVLDDFGVEYWKPSILIFSKISSKYGNNLSDYFFVGNGEEDFAFSKTLGINFILINRYNKIRGIRPEKNDNSFVVKNLYELLQIVGGKK